MKIVNWSNRHRTFCQPWAGYGWYRGRVGGGDRGFAGAGMGAFEAAAAGAYLHGLAGELARMEVGEAGMVAGNVLACLPQAWRDVAGG